MEDILEEIVGQIQDEMDRESPDVTQLGANTWLVDGGLLLERAVSQNGVTCSRASSMTIKVLPQITPRAATISQLAFVIYGVSFIFWGSPVQERQLGAHAPM